MVMVYFYIIGQCLVNSYNEILNNEYYMEILYNMYVKQRCGILL